MRTAKLIRDTFLDDGTFGRFILDDETEFCSGELPWKNNQHDISCIPTGTYLCKWMESPKHGWCYHVTGVPNRSVIEIHVANFMGDTALGKFSELLGCISLGMSIRIMNKDGYPPQTGVALSKHAIDLFEDNVNQEDFNLTIENENE